MSVTEERKKNRKNNNEYVGVCISIIMHNYTFYLIIMIYDIEQKIII